MKMGPWQLLASPSRPSNSHLRHGSSFFIFSQEHHYFLLYPLTSDTASVREVCTAHAEIGKAIGNAILTFCERHNILLDSIDLIASHGQTVWHEIDSSARAHSTLQLGDPARIAARTGVTVASDFRTKDLAYGGQGAPLVPIYDMHMLRYDPGSAPLSQRASAHKHWRAVQNIGGIGNVTFLPPVGSASPPVAFDTGPGNVLLDMSISRHTNGAKLYDENGECARQGTASQQLLAEMLHDTEYFHLAPPKSTGRELFSEQYFLKWQGRADELSLSFHDTIATFVELTALSIALAYKQFAPREMELKEVIVAGGGCRNGFLLERLHHQLRAQVSAEVCVHTHERFGINSDGKEAELFALLGFMCVRGAPASLPTTTGASRAAVLGNITPGDNYRTLLRECAAEWQ